MGKQITFTSTLPETVLKELDEYAAMQKTKKNSVIEKALRKYFEEHRKSMFIKSYKRANQDIEMINMAEEGIEDYLNLLDK
ncbi:MAG: hypothetical protein ABI729_04995 [Chitinophagales bacterium]